MSALQPHERAWTDQQDARLRDAVNILLDGAQRIDETPASLRGLAAQHLALTLHEHLDQLDEEEVRLLAHHAVVRLAAHIRNGHRGRHS